MAIDGSCTGDCDRECKDHGKTTLLVQQHNERIGTVEGTIDLMGRDIAKMEGRLNSFIWVLGLVFGTILILAFYGSLQMAQFKDIYMDDTIKGNKVLSEMKSSVKSLNKDINSMNEDIKALEKLRAEQKRSEG